MSEDEVGERCLSEQLPLFLLELSMKKYKCYVFDFDMTLINTVGYLYPIYKYVYSTVGFNITDEQCDVFIKQSVLKTFEALKLNAKQIATVTKAWNEVANDPKYFKGSYIYKDARDLIGKLNESGLKMAIVSGNSKETIKAMLDFHGIDSNSFIDILGLYDFKEQKPSAEPLLEFLRRNPEYNKEDIVYVGDALQDKKCAVNAGVDYIIVSREGNHIDDKDILDLREVY